MAKTKETEAVQQPKAQTLTIKPPNMQILPLTIEGEEIYVQNRFANKSEIQSKQEEGSTAKSKKERKPKDFEDLYKKAMHIGKDGKYGIPAPAFRNAAISACRIVGFQMTKGKLAIFVVADTHDVNDNTPLVHISGQPSMRIDPVRNDSGVIDLRARPMWDVGWRANLRIRFDADVFTATDVANLIARVGMQVGVGEGRPDSKDSNGMGWGLFRIVS